MCDSFHPPNDWNCRCSAMQVRKGKCQSPHPNTSPKNTLSPSAPAVTLTPLATLKTLNAQILTLLSLARIFVPDNEVCAACEILQQCAGNNEKSQRAIERTHYLHEMKPLLNRKVEKTVNGNKLNIGFTKEGNNHLFADTFGRTHIVTKEDLKDLATYLENAEFIDDSALTHSRNDNIEHFYYFKTQINGRWVRLNVAKEIRIRRTGQIQVQYFLYSVNDFVE